MVTHGAEAVAAWIWTATWQSCVIAGMVWVLTTALREWLTPGCRRALWSLVLVRLVMPGLPESRWSAWGLMERRTPAASSVVGETAVRANVEGWTIERGPIDDFEVPSQPSRVRADPVANVPWLLLSVWSGGVCVFLLALAVANVRLSRRLRNAASVDDADVLALLAECKRRMGVRRRVEVVEFDTHGPALAGLLRPKILLPARLHRRLTREQLRFVILHELAHLKRWDILADWVVAIVHAAHWFNPAAWLAVARLRAERELSRDEMVIRSTSGQSRVDYGEAIVRVVEEITSRSARFGTVGLLEERGQLRGRITAIAKGGASPWLALPLTLVLVVVVGCSTMTNGPEASGPSPAKEVATATFDPVTTKPPTTLRAARRGEADPAVLAALENRIALVRFDDVPLETAIDFFRDTTRCNIFVNWRALEAAGVDRRKSVKARLRDIKASKALELVLRDAGAGEVGLSYVVEGDVVTVSTADELSQNVAIRVYDVRDLLTLVPEFGGGPDIDPNRVETRERNEEAGKRIANLLTEAIDTKSWVENGGRVGSVRFLSGQVIVTQTPENHRAIAGLLDVLRQRWIVQVVIEAKFLSVDRGSLKRDPTGEKLLGRPGHPDSPGLVAEDQAVKALLEAVQRDAGSNVLSAPKMIVYNNQAGKITVGSEKPYTKSYGPRKPDGPRDPITETALSGISMTVTATASADRKFVTVQVHPMVTELLDVRREKWEGAEPGETLMVDRPVMRTQEVNTSVAVPNAGTFAVVLPITQGRKIEDAKATLLLLKATVIQPARKQFPLLNPK